MCQRQLLKATKTIQTLTYEFFKSIFQPKDSRVHAYNLSKALGRHIVIIIVIVVIVIVGNAETWRESIRENHPSRARTRTKWRACNSVTPVRDQTVGRRAAYLYTLRARRPVERRRSCRVVSHREEPKAHALSPSLSFSLSPSLLSTRAVSCTCRAPPPAGRVSPLGT